MSLLFGENGVGGDGSDEALVENGDSEEEEEFFDALP